MIWRDLLQARLREIRPESVCALDAAAQQLATAALQDTPVHPPDTSRRQPCALALGVDALNGLDARQAQHLINLTRLYLAPRILLAATADCALDEDTFRALGFALFATDPAENVRIHYYDLDTYKTVPDWLNPRFWAHPERWEP
ncbi:MAG TPA: DUF6231 family protein [Thiobacillaceae bacterium]